MSAVPDLDAYLARIGYTGPRAPTAAVLTGGRIVLGVVDIPAGQERPAEPSKVHTEDEIPEIPADLDPDMDA